MENWALLIKFRVFAPVGKAILFAYIFPTMEFSSLWFAPFFSLQQECCCPVPRFLGFDLIEVHRRWVRRRIKHNNVVVIIEEDEIVLTRPVQFQKQTERPAFLIVRTV